MGENTIYRIVIADDDDVVRMLISGICMGAAVQAGKSPEVHCFDDGAPALEYLVGNPADLLITDQNMKNLHGSELVLQARAHYKGPVIMMSAGSPDAVSSVQVMAEELGADFLEKPLRSIKELENLVAKYAPK